MTVRIVLIVEPSQEIFNDMNEPNEHNELSVLKLFNKE
jgi:hypothetical protein